MKNKSCEEEIIRVVRWLESGEHDISFCGNSDKCNRAEDCCRAHRPAKQISVVNFWKKGKRCKRYISLPPADCIGKDDGKVSYKPPKKPYQLYASHAKVTWAK
jgi:hypothetical protein